MNQRASIFAWIRGFFIACSIPALFGSVWCCLRRRLSTMKDTKRHKIVIPTLGESCLCSFVFFVALIPWITLN